MVTMLHGKCRKLKLRKSNSNPKSQILGTIHNVTVTEMKYF